MKLPRDVIATETENAEAQLCLSLSHPSTCLIEAVFTPRAPCIRAWSVVGRKEADAVAVPQTIGDMAANVRFLLGAVLGAFYGVHRLSLRQLWKRLPFL